MPVGPAPENAADLSFLGPRRGVRTRRSLAGVLCQLLDLLVLSLVLLAVLSHDASASATPRLAAPAAWFNLYGLVTALLALVAWHALLVSSGVYSRSLGRSLAEYLFRLLIGLNCCACAVGLAEIVFGRGPGVWATVLWFWAGGAAGLLLERIALFLFYPMLTAHRPRRTIVIGVGELARRAERLCLGSARCRLVGVIEPAPRNSANDKNLVLHSGGARLGTLDNLERILAENAVDVVAIALPFATHFDQVGRAINICQKAGVESHYLTSDPRQTRPNVPSGSPPRS